MSYTDLTSTFINKLLNSYQNGQKFVDNDNYLYEMLRTYRRPNLAYVDGQYIDVENNVPSDANATKIIFPDGDVRTVSEAVSSTIHKYRRLDRTATPSLVATHDSGASNPANNTWIAVYAVKTTDDSSKFVLVGTTALPLAANYASLNSSYGTNSWLYLGLIRNGDNSGSGSGWLDFQQMGNVTMFRNTVVSSSTNPKTGIRLANSATGTQTTYTRSSGTGATNLPDNIHICCYGVSADTDGQFNAKESSGNAVFSMVDTTSGGTDGYSENLWVPADSGIQLNTSGSRNQDIFLMGYVDHVLGIGSNPQL